MKTWRYTLIEKDPDRPWIVRSMEPRTVELEDGESFHEWARGRFPEEHNTVELDPGQEGQWGLRA